MSSSSVHAANEGTVLGRITEPDGSTGVSNASVTLRTSNWTYSQYKSTSSDGSFTFWDVPAGSYLLEVWASHPSYFAPDAQSVTATENQTTNLGSVKLVNPNFFCKVTTPDGASGVANASVNVHTSGWTISRSASTDSSGNCKTALSTTGDYIVETWASHDTYSKPDVKKITYSGSAVYLDGTNSSSPLKLNAPLMKGQVKLPDGTAAQYTSINVTVNDRYVAWASTDSNGNFKIDDFFTDPNNLTPDSEDSKSTGTYTVKITPPSSPPGLSSPPNLTATLTKGTTHTTYLTSPVVLSQSVKTITGTVKRTNGVAVTDASVSAWKRGNGWGYASADVGSDGSFSFKVSECGTWEVSTYAKWTSGTAPDWTYDKAPQSVTFTCDTQPETKTVNFSVVTFSATIKGNVYLPNGSTVPSGQYWSVSAWRDYGAGNWSQTTNGAYSMKLAPGTYTVSTYGSSNDYGTPQYTVSLKENETLTMNITLLDKNSTIKVTVKDNKGNAVSNQWCSTWSKSGSGWASGTTDANGEASLKVTAGTWMVSCYPSGNANASSLSSILATGTNYVATDPPQEVTTAANTTSTATFVFALADATLQGTIVKSDGTTIDNMWGWISAQKCTQTSATTGFYYSGLGGSITNGSFTLRVPSGICWKLGASLPYGSDYSATTTSTKEVTPTAGETVSNIKLTVVQNNSTISGKFKDSKGNTLTNIYGSVFASNGVAYQWASLTNGEYSLKVSADTWDIGCWVDYSTSQQYYMNGLCERKLTIGANETSTQDFVLQNADSTITVKTVDPDGKALANVLVKATTQYGAAKTISYSMYGSWFNRDTNTDQTGSATLKVPAGTYVVSSTIPPDLGFINPEPEAVTTAADSPASVTMKFRKPDGYIVGTITNQDGSANTGGGTVTAYTTSGAYTETEVQPNGTYSLPIVNEDSTWYIEAAKDVTETSGATSEEKAVTIEDDGSTTVNLSLTEASTMPAGSTASFSTNTQQELALPNGATVTLPANSLSTQNITANVSVTPSVEGSPNTATDAQVGKEIAYDVTATQASGNNAGQPITNLTSTATVCLPYDEQELSDLGLQESDITVKTWDENAGTYGTVQSVVVKEDQNKVCASTNHLTRFVITAAPVEKKKPLPSAPGTPGSPGAPGGDTKELPPIITPEVKELRNRQVSVITTSKGVATISIYNRDGTLAKSFKPFGVKKGTSFGMIVADVTGDKREKIVVWEASGKNLPVKIFTTSGSLVGSIQAMKGKKMVVTSLDANGDKTAELLLTSSDATSATHYTYKNSGMKKFVSWNYPQGSTGASSVAVGNFAGNAAQEVAIVHGGNTAQVTIQRINIAKKKVELVASSKDSTLPTPSSALAADTGGDGHDELVLNGSQKILVVSISGKKLKSLGTITLNSPTILSLGDLTGDHKADLVLKSLEKASLRVLTYTKGKFRQKGSVLYPFGTAATGTVQDAVGDFNADGKKELVVSQPKGSKLRVFSFTNGKLKLKTTLDIGTTKTKKAIDRIFASDLNSDGRPEIMASTSSSVTITKYTGKGLFAIEKKISVSPAISEVVTASRKR